MISGRTIQESLCRRARPSSKSSQIGSLVGYGFSSASIDIRSSTVARSKPRRDDQQIGWDVWRGDPVRLWKDIYKNISRVEVLLAFARIGTHL